MSASIKIHVNPKAKKPFTFRFISGNGKIVWFGRPRRHRRQAWADWNMLAGWARELSRGKGKHRLHGELLITRCRNGQYRARVRGDGHTISTEQYPRIRSAVGAFRVVQDYLNPI